MKYRHQVQNNPQSGVVLVFAILLTAVLTFLAASSFGSTESAISIQRNESDALKAELAAQSGLEHARLQLIHDPYWEGTEAAISVGESHFEIETELVENANITGLQISVKSEGLAGNGKRVLQMDIIVSDNGGMGDVGAVFLSSNIDMKGGHINGNILIPDQVGAIEDYTLDEFGNAVWTPNDDPLGVLNFQGLVVNHEAHQYTENLYFNGSPEIILEEQSYKMPAWNLDPYLDTSSEDITVLNGVTDLTGMNTDSTVVVVLEEGQTLTVTNSQLHGGLVVWAPPDWDLRSGARNQVIVNGSNIGTGSAPHVGLMAPAASISGEASSSNFHGLCFWNSIQHLDNAHLDGALVVVNEVVDCYRMIMNQHPPTMGDMPDGISFAGNQPGLEFLDSGEYIEN